MKTRCPECQTTFWVTPEQIKARAGTVRCGQCQKVFNALDHLLEEPLASSATPPQWHEPAASPPATIDSSDSEPSLPKQDDWHVPPGFQSTPLPFEIEARPRPITGASGTADVAPLAEPAEPYAPAPANDEMASDALSEEATQELAKSAGLIVPRETTEIPGYSRWAESMMSSEPLSAPTSKAGNRPFILVALLLLLTLVGQIIFHARSEIAVATPSLRPALEAMSSALGSDLPLPRHSELVSIETSDLQADATRGNVLVLQATLRNRASFAQEYPLLELSLTDTQDGAIARKVFQPADYLPPQTTSRLAFPANSDIALRLWVEARGISAAGYRLYVFYP